MRIFLKKSDYVKIVTHALSGLPNEVCGLVAGIISGEGKIVEKIYTLTNTDESPEHFSIDLYEQLAALKDMWENGIIPLGNFHSHPNTPARPSGEDIRFAFDFRASYLILSLMDKNMPVLNAFHIHKGIVSPEKIEIV